jgi:hypothetical protein
MDTTPEHMDLVERIVQEIKSDTDDEESRGVKIVWEYQHATDDQRMCVDRIFLQLCGWSLKTLIESQEDLNYNPLTVDGQLFSEFQPHLQLPKTHTRVSLDWDDHPIISKGNETVSDSVAEYGIYTFEVYHYRGDEQRNGGYFVACMNMSISQVIWTQEFVSRLDSAKKLAEEFARTLPVPE